MTGRLNDNNNSNNNDNVLLKLSIKFLILINIVFIIRISIIFQTYCYFLWLQLTAKILTLVCVFLKLVNHVYYVGHVWYSPRIRNSSDLFLKLFCWLLFCCLLSSYTWLSLIIVDILLEQLLLEISWGLGSCYLFIENVFVSSVRRLGLILDGL